MSVQNSSVTAGESASLITAEARALVGTLVSSSRGVVVRRDFQRWASAVGDHNPLYFDRDFARAHGYRDVVAPALYIQTVPLGVADLRELRPDGTPNTVGLPLPHTPRLMAGGDAWEFGLPVYDGDTLTASRRIESVDEKQGRSGAMVVVTSSTTYTNQGGGVVATCTDTLLARPATDGDARA